MISALPLPTKYWLVGIARIDMAEALRFNVTELSAAAVAFSLIVGPKSDKAATDCTDADCVEADSVESVSHAVRFNTVVQIEMSNIKGRNSGGAIEEVAICYP